MNRRGFITSALKVTAAGLLVPEYLFGRSMVGWTAGVDPAGGMSVFVHRLTAEHLERMSLEWIKVFFDASKYSYAVHEEGMKVIFDKIAP